MNSDETTEWGYSTPVNFAQEQPKTLHFITMKITHTYKLFCLQKQDNKL